MTEPIFMAAPPEVWSTLLSSGPGAGPLLAAAGAWASLSAEYAAVAQELGATLNAVQTGAWQGPSAEYYIAANVPYLAWLIQQSHSSAAAATQQEIAAAAYTSALATMPTPAELATNHVAHAGLLATNFFGINTIPIALNEADYMRMWVQAAITMTGYQTAAAAAVAATPADPAAPAIVRTGAAESRQSNFFNSGPTTQDGGHISLHWLENKIAIAENLILHGEGGELFTLIPHWAGEAVGAIAPPLQPLVPPLVQAAMVLAPVIGPSLAATTPAAGLAGLGGLAGLDGPDTPADSTPLVPGPTETAPAFETPPGEVTSGSPATAAPPAHLPSAPAAAAVSGLPPGHLPPAVPPPIGTAGGAFPYLVMARGSEATPATGSPPRARTRQPVDAAAGTAAAAREQPHQRRHRRVESRVDRGYRYEYLDPGAYPDGDPGPPTTAASDGGAGPIGFPGTTSDSTAVTAAGLTALTGESGATASTMPMVPQTWDLDQDATPEEPGAD